MLNKERFRGVSREMGLLVAMVILTVSPSWGSPFDQFVLVFQLESVAPVQFVVFPYRSPMVKRIEAHVNAFMNLFIRFGSLFDRAINLECIFFLLLVHILIHPEDLAFPINLKISSDRYKEQM